MSFKSFFAMNWLRKRTEEKRSMSSRPQTPRDVKRKNKNGHQVRHTPWRKSAPCELKFSTKIDESCQTVESKTCGSFNERPVDCLGIVQRETPPKVSSFVTTSHVEKKRRPLTTNFELKFAHKSKSHFDLANAAIDLDEEIRKRSGTSTTDSNFSMPKVVGDRCMKNADSGYDTTSSCYNSPETRKNLKEPKRTDSIEKSRTFNNYFDYVRSEKAIGPFVEAQPETTQLKLFKDNTLASYVQVDSCHLTLSGLEDSANIFESADDETNYSNRFSNNGPKVVVAIDIGTTFSGYAYSFIDGQDLIYIMRKPDGCDPGVINQKCPTCLLLSADGQFHSFGYSARDFYHDLEPHHAKQYLYFERFKTSVQNKNISASAKFRAANGVQYPAVEIFAHCLQYFKRLSIAELSDVVGCYFDESNIQWILTVPAIWTHSAKQLMRLAAQKCGMTGRMTLALEPEAASIYCRELRQIDVIDNLTPIVRPFLSMPTTFRKTFRKQLIEAKTQMAVNLGPGTAYMVVDCGGGTVDITVHQVSENGNSLTELFRASGGPHGSCEVDVCFEALLHDVFTADFVEKCKTKYPAAFVDLSLAFESRKRAAHPYKQNSLNVALPFSFVEFHKKTRGFSVKKAVQRYNSKQISWTSQGMLTLSAEAMNVLFSPTLSAIVNCISDALASILEPVSHLFLVGGFAESSLLQHRIKIAFGQKLKVIIPPEVSTAVLKGAVLYGLHPERITVRRSRFTYGIGVLHPFDPTKHPADKLLVQNGRKFCKDVFDKFITIDQSIAVGEEIHFAYCPIDPDKREIVIQLYSSGKENPKFVSDVGVQKCASLKLLLPELSTHVDKHREIKSCMKFGETEIQVSATDVVSGGKVECVVDFSSQ